jgi:hypothetical protein
MPQVKPIHHGGRYICAKRHRVKNINPKVINKLVERVNNFNPF